MAAKPAKGKRGRKPKGTAKTSSKPLIYAPLGDRAPLPQEFVDLAFGRDRFGDLVVETVGKVVTVTIDRPPCAAPGASAW